MLRVGICGGVSVEVDGRALPESLLAGRQGRLVLAYLTCERHRSVPRDELAELLWPDRLPSSWTASLSVVISKLRRLLAEAGLDPTTALASAFGSYRLHLPVDSWVDWEIAARSVEAADRALATGDFDSAIKAAEEAAQIARRGFLTDNSPWVDSQRQRLRDVHVRALHAQTEAHLAAGRRGRALIAARGAARRSGCHRERTRDEAPRSASAAIPQRTLGMSGVMVAPNSVVTLRRPSARK